jgi:hypothetical protein
LFSNVLDFAHPPFLPFSLPRNVHLLFPERGRRERLALQSIQKLVPDWS